MKPAQDVALALVSLLALAGLVVILALGIRACLVALAP